MQASRWVLITIGTLIVSAMLIFIGIEMVPIAQISSSYISKNLDLTVASVSAAPEDVLVEYSLKVNKCNNDKIKQRTDRINNLNCESRGGHSIFTIEST